MNDPYNLQRFIAAQEPVYGHVLSELRVGLKQSHWMWFIFPQIAGLGHSDIARKFAISGLEEATHYLLHATLGPRLLECSHLVALVQKRSIDDIFGYPDNLKFHSSMTLLAEANEKEPVFKECLEKYFAGQRDPSTVALITR